MENFITETAVKILIIGGVFNIAFGIIVGHILGLHRLKNPDSNYKYLLSAHKAGLQQGFMLLGLVFALMLSPLPNNVETISAILILFSTVLLDLGEMMNWFNRVEDEFKTRPSGFYVKLISGVLLTIGFSILLYGIILII